MTFLEQVDIVFFRLFNQSLVHPFADDLMVFLTDARLSLHIILLIVLFILLRRGWKETVFFLLVAAAAVGMSDYIASGLLKPFVQRIRPCFALPDVRLLIVQPNSYSFASSHAANSTATAVVIWIFFHSALSQAEKIFRFVVLVYALLISWSRIYVGVHYPGDVVAGIIIGIVCAMLVYLLLSWTFKNVVQNRYLAASSSQRP